MHVTERDQNVYNVSHRCCILVRLVPCKTLLSVAPDSAALKVSGTSEAFLSGHSVLLAAFQQVAGRTCVCRGGHSSAAAAALAEGRRAPRAAAWRSPAGNMCGTAWRQRIQTLVSYVESVFPPHEVKGRKKREGRLLQPPLLWEGP